MTYLWCQPKSFRLTISYFVFYSLKTSGQKKQRRKYFTSDRSTVICIELLISSQVFIPEIL